MTEEGACHWRPCRVPGSGRPPRGLQPWIDEPGSLTRRLRRTCAGAFTVRVLREGWDIVWRDEARRLRIPGGRRVWAREVLLRNGPVAWIFARTVIPERVLHGRFRRLRHLGRQPLGQVLFGRYRISRGAIEVARLGAGDALRARAEAYTGGNGILWARRSVFRVEHRPLLVTEVFLPPLVHPLLRQDAGGVDALRAEYA